MNRFKQLAGILTEVEVKTNKATDLQFILRDLGDAYGEQIADDLTKDEFKNYTVGQIIDDWKKLKKSLKEDATSAPAAPSTGTQPGKVQGSINLKLFQGLNIPDFNISTFTTTIGKVKNGTALNVNDNKILANTMAALIKTSDDALLGKIFANLKQIEAK